MQRRDYPIPVGGRLLWYHLRRPLCRYWFERVCECPDGCQPAVRIQIASERRALQESRPEILSFPAPLHQHRCKYSEELYRSEIASVYWDHVSLTGEEPDLLRDVLGKLSMSVSLSTHYRYVKRWHLSYPPPKP